MKIIKVVCPNCNGEGEVCEFFVAPAGTGCCFENFKKCERCGGTGKVDKAVLE